MSAQQVFRNTLIVVLTLAVAYTLWASIRILIVLLVAIIVASAVRPSVLWLKNRRIPEGLAILIIYAAIALAIFVLAVLVLPPAARQFAGYIENEQNLATRLIDAQNWIQTTIQDRTGSTVTLLDPEGIRTTITHIVTELKATAPALAGEFGGLLGDFVLVFVIGVYWLTSRDQAVAFVLQLFPIGQRAMVATIIQEIETSLGLYVRGIVLVCLFVGVANFAILSLFQVPNAVTLGFIVGITTALPIIGGYVGAGTAVLLALLSSPLHALFAMISFVLVQQVENHYLTPRVMSRSVGLNPILIIVFLFIGFAVGGVIGALISVPLAGTLTILLRHLVIEPRKEENAPQFVEGGILIPGRLERAPAAKETKPTPTVIDPGHSPTTT
jgi:predicted PurR-regulated permease PerM